MARRDKDLLADLLASDAWSVWWPGPDDGIEEAGFGHWAIRAQPGRMEPMGERRIGRFKLVGTLGKGASATVIEAFDEASGEAVALKIPHANLVGDEAARRSVAREAELASRVTHSNVVHVREIVSERNAFALVLDLVRGTTLRALLRSGALAPDAAAIVGTDLAHGLQAIHDARGSTGRRIGLVHGDVTSANTLIGVDGIARLTDFGLAKRRAISALTGSGFIYGTPGYVAPEVVRGEPMTPVSELFSLGVVLFEALSGKRPFDRRETLETLRATVEDRTPLLGPPLGEIIAEMLRKRPEQRVTSATKVIELLRPIATEQARQALVDRQISK